MSQTKIGSAPVAALGLVIGITLAPTAPSASELASPVVAQAQERRQGQQAEPGRSPMSQRRMMQMMDQNGDGFLDHEEFVETPRPGAGANTELAERNRAAHFDQLDRDGDGRLSPEELSRMPGRSPR